MSPYRVFYDELRFLKDVFLSVAFPVPPLGFSRIYCVYLKKFCEFDFDGSFLLRGEYEV